MRARLGKFYGQQVRGERSRHEAIVHHIEVETGVKVPVPVLGPDVPKFMSDAELRDVLDSITLVFQALRSTGWPGIADEWRNFVVRVFQEENLGYTLDDACGVHFAVDGEFERNRVATLSGLGNSRYGAVRKAFEDAHAALDRHPPDTTSALRFIFEANEILSKLVVDSRKMSRLGDAAIKECLVPLVDTVYVPANEANAARQVLLSFADWTNAVQPYRHGQKTEAPTPPPIDLTITIFSAGATFLRFLISFDQALRKQEGASSR